MTCLPVNSLVRLPWPPAAAAAVGIESDPSAAAGDRRARRTCFLLAVVIAFSALDFVLTLGFMKTTGMAEANPFVHALLGMSNSALALGIFKALTVAAPVIVVYCTRRLRPGHLAAWVAVGVLSLVLVQWVRYATFVGDIDPGLLTQMVEVDPDWVVIP